MARTKAPGGAPWTRQAACDLLAREPDSTRLGIFTRSQDLQDLAAVWPLVPIRTRKPQKAAPRSTDQADLVAWAWDGAEPDREALRDLLGPTFPLAATLAQARALGIVLPDGRLHQYAAGWLAAQGLRLAEAITARGKRSGGGGS